MSHPQSEQLAIAGIELMHAATPTACVSALLGHAVSFGGARSAAFVGDGLVGDVQMGIVPSTPNVTGVGSESGTILADHGTWVAVCVRGIDSDARWSGILWLEGLDSDDHRRVARLLARQAGVALASILRRAELEVRERQHMALVEAGKSLSQEHSLEGVLQRIVELAADLSGAAYGALGVVDPTTGETLSDFITVGLDEATRERIGVLPTGKGLLGVLIQDPRPLRLERISDDPRSAGFPPHHPPMDSFLGVPIRTHRETKGRIYLTEKRGADAFSAADEQIVVTLASQAGIAIENAELYEALQRANAQLTEADAHKSSFLASMSHELRSPLNTIIGYTRLLIEDGDSLSPEQLEDLDIIRASSTHLLGLITDLLDLSRIEAGRVELHLEVVDVRDLVDDVISAVRPQLESSEIRHSCSSPSDLRLACDRTRVRQMLLNLLGNAIKFAPGGHIDVTVTSDGSMVTFAVEDDGAGIPAADLARIFESFYQSHAAMARTPREQEGAGLGLAITRMLAELHGGSVAIESTEGTGTRVLVTLPLEAKDAP